MNDTMEQAREGAEKIDDMLRKKQLSVYHDKSKYMVLGQESFKEKVKKDTETNPVKMHHAFLPNTFHLLYKTKILDSEGTRS